MNTHLDIWIIIAYTNVALRLILMNDDRPIYGAHDFEYDIPFMGIATRKYCLW